MDYLCILTETHLCRRIPKQQTCIIKIQSQKSHFASGFSQKVAQNQFKLTFMGTSVQGPARGAMADLTWLRYQFYLQGPSRLVDKISIRVTITLYASATESGGNKHKTPWGHKDSKIHSRRWAGGRLNSRSGIGAGTRRTGIL